MWGRIIQTVATNTKNNTVNAWLNAVAKSLITAYFFIAVIYYFINMLLFVDNKE